MMLQHKQRKKTIVISSSISSTRWVDASQMEERGKKSWWGKCFIFKLQCHSEKQG